MPRRRSRPRIVRSARAPRTGQPSAPRPEFGRRRRPAADPAAGRRARTPRSSCWPSARSPSAPRSWCSGTHSAGPPRAPRRASPRRSATGPARPRSPTSSRTGELRSVTISTPKGDIVHPGRRLPVADRGRQLRRPDPVPFLRRQRVPSHRGAPGRDAVRDPGRRREARDRGDPVHDRGRAGDHDLPARHGGHGPDQRSRQPDVGVLHRPGRFGGGRAVVREQLRHPREGDHRHGRRRQDLPGVRRRRDSDEPDPDDQRHRLRRRRPRAARRARPRAPQPTVEPSSAGSPAPSATPAT